MNRALGVILCVFGLVILAWGGATFTTQKKFIDVGPIHATRDEKHTLPYMPIAGIVVILGGVALLVTSKK